LVLSASYEGTIIAAGILAARKDKRISVYLTSLGGGVFGNKTEWIKEAINNALKK